MAGDARVHALVERWPWLAARPGLVLGGTLLLAGSFQFSALKKACLTACRSPLSLLWQHYRRGIAGAFTLGVRHAVYCLGWAIVIYLKPIPVTAPAAIDHTAQGQTLLGEGQTTQAIAEFDEALKRRHLAKPGVTGLWQVEANHKASFDEYRRLDLFYVDNWSVAMDIAVMIDTLPAICRRGLRALLHKRVYG